ncbi:MAG: hypothetical protein E5V89_02875 [Mesorhizobium sp.]|nr:MAG: hypothetical protein E5W94_19265 [Mesorhizobium sp.]TIV72923.1 MAG: hypothetical protein E5V89_02875 [Mesorhizobium sp.]
MDHQRRSDSDQIGTDYQRRSESRQFRDASRNWRQQRQLGNFRCPQSGNIHRPMTINDAVLALLWLMLHNECCA